MSEIIIPTDKELEEAFEEQHKLYNWAFSLEQSRIDGLCDMGYYNDAMKGYLIAACKIARTLEPAVDLTDSQIKTLVKAMSWALDEKNKKEAEKMYKEF